MTRATVVVGISTVKTVVEDGGNVVCKFQRTSSANDEQVRGWRGVSA